MTVTDAASSVIRWLKRLLWRRNWKSDREEGTTTTFEGLARDGDDALGQQAELAEVVKAKAAFAAMMLDDANDRGRYETLRDDALIILASIDEEFYGSYARHHLIRLYVAAGETGRAADLLKEVEDDFILDDILEEFPTLPRGLGSNAGDE